MDELENYRDETEKSIEALRKKVVDMIAVESEALVEQLITIAKNEDDPRVKLQAIGMLLDRSVPKLGVDRPEMEANTETQERRRMREEIEKMLEEDDEEDGF